MNNTSNESATIDKQNSSRERHFSSSNISIRKKMINYFKETEIPQSLQTEDWMNVCACLFIVFVFALLISVFKCVQKRWPFDCKNIWKAIGLYLMKFVWVQDLCTAKKNKQEQQPPPPKKTQPKKMRTVLIKKNLTIKYKNICSKKKSYKFESKLINSLFFKTYCIYMGHFCVNLEETRIFSIAWYWVALEHLFWGWWALECPVGDKVM